MSHLVPLGILFLVTAWLLGRGWRRGRDSARRDLPTEVRSELRARETSEAAHVRKMEIRLHDYGREIEARAQTRLAALDRLVREADREIVRLTRLLELRRGDAPPAAAPRSAPGREASGPDILALPSAAARDRAAEPEALTAAERQMLLHLEEAGYSPAELARLLARPLPAIHAALAPERRDAA
ncbi:MAG: hypothetical protein WD069_19065 [Planctomycetales bacterium]